MRMNYSNVLNITATKLKQTFRLFFLQKSIFFSSNNNKYHLIDDEFLSIQIKSNKTTSPLVASHQRFQWYLTYFIMAFKLGLHGHFSSARTIDLSS